jgi:hypothetical protein
MKRFIIKLALLFVSISAYSQNTADSIFDFILYDYLPNRVQTENFYIQNRTYNIRISDDSLFLEQFKKDTIYASQPWKDLVSAFDILNSQEDRIHKRHFNHKFISEKKRKKESALATSVNSIMLHDPLSEWKKFQSKYTDCEGIVTLTYPSVSTDNKNFILYIDFYNASEKGFGDLIFCTKQDNKWTVVKEINRTQNLTSIIVVAH